MSNPFAAKEEITVQEALNAIYEDSLMLLEGEWEPDHSSTEAHIAMIQVIADSLGLELNDTRD